MEKEIKFVSSKKYEDKKLRENMSNEGNIYRLFYFFYWAAASSLIPYLGIYYKNLNIIGHQIGLLGGIPYIFVFIWSIFFGFLADLTQKYRLLLKISILGLIVSVSLIFFADSFQQLVPVIALYAVFSSPINPIVDKLTLDWASRCNGEYGKIRIGGSLGYGLVVTITGFIITLFNLKWIFLVYVFFILICYSTTFYFNNSTKQIVKEKVSIKDFIDSFKNVNFIIFLLLIITWGMGESSVTNFLFLHMFDIGSNYILMGLSISFAIISESIVFLHIAKINKRIGLINTLVVGFIIQIIRLLGLSYIRTPWMGILAQLFGGASFGFIWAGGVAYVNKNLPKKLSTTAQGLRTGFQSGLGYAIGVIFSGYLYENVGSALLYRYMSIIVLFGIILFIFTNSFLGNHTGKRLHNSK